MRGLHSSVAAVWGFAALLCAAPASAACPVDTSQLRTHVDAAWAEYSAGRTASFLQRVAVIDGEVRCLSEVIDPQTASRVHLVDGLRAGLAKDAVVMLASFRGAYAADPALEPGAEIAAPGSRVHDALEMARTAGGGSTHTLVLGSGVAVHVDGAPSSDVPLERASIVQLSGTSLRTWSLMGSGDVPAELIAAAQVSTQPAASTQNVSQLPADPNRKRTSRSLLTAGIASGVASAGSLIAAQSYKSGYQDIEDPSVADDQYALNRAFGFVGYGLGVTAVGFVTAAVVVGKW